MPRQRSAEESKKYYAANRHRWVARKNALKAEAYRMMGGCCAECGDSEITHLSIDHVDGDGKHHRRPGQRGRGLGKQLYAQIISGRIEYRVRLLCYNCHYALTKHYFIPHIAMQTLYCGGQ